MHLLHSTAVRTRLRPCARGLLASWVLVLVGACTPAIDDETGSCTERADCPALACACTDEGEVITRSCREQLCAEGELVCPEACDRYGSDWSGEAVDITGAREPPASCQEDCGDNLCDPMVLQCISAEGIYAGPGVEVLIGDAVGLGQSRDLNLRTVEAEMAGDAGPFDVVRAFISRDNEEQETGSVLVPMRNLGSESRCYVQADRIEVFDAAGNSLYRDRAFLTSAQQGSALAGGPVASCLEPGRAGLFLVQTSSDPFFSRAARVEVELAASTQIDTTIPAGRAKPTAFSSTNQRLEVTIEATGSESITVGGASAGVAVLLDDHDRPSFFTLLGADATTILEPGQTTTIKATVLWPGSSTKVVVFADWD